MTDELLHPNELLHLDYKTLCRRMLALERRLEQAERILAAMGALRYAEPSRWEIVYDEGLSGEEA